MIPAVLLYSDDSPLKIIVKYEGLLRQKLNPIQKDFQTLGLLEEISVFAQMVLTSLPYF